jgi:Tfp pilus assembly protein PilX
VLTILAVSGVVTSTLELRMVSNQQQQENAFQAADSGIEIALATEPYTTTVPQTATGTLPNGDTYDYELRYAGESSAPPTGYSLGTGFQAYHFVVESSGQSTGSAESDHTQGFYVVGPGG